MARPARMESLDAEPDGRRRSPSAARNQAEILPVLAPRLAAARRVLEIASGTGEHAVCFARALPGATWVPTDRDEDALQSVRAWRAQAGLPNLAEPRRLDVEDPRAWDIEPVDAVVAVNFLHIVPWSACRAFVAGAARVLADGGLLVVYGAMFRAGRTPEPSNLDFDAQLRAAGPEFGVRQLDAVADAARAHGLALDEVIDMPHRNVVVTFRRRSAESVDASA